MRFKTAAWLPTGRISHALAAHHARFGVAARVALVSPDEVVAVAGVEVRGVGWVRRNTVMTGRG